MRITLSVRYLVKTAPPWREAATLIIATEAKNAPKPGIEYLVTQRSPKSSFYPNGICFPGGTVSKADSSAEWTNLYHKAGIDLTSYSFLHQSAHRPPIYENASMSLSLSKEVILRLTAIRESFEESGVLVCKSTNPQRPLPVGDTEVLSYWQKRVKENPASFLELCDQLYLLPDLQALVEWSNWLTPTTFSARYRFDTMFYIVTLETPPQVVIDQEEVVHAFTAGAQQLLEFSEDSQKSGSLPPPQVIELTKMKSISDLPTLRALAKLRQTLGLERWCPVIADTKNGGKINLLPGDDLYPQHASPEEQYDIVFDSTSAELTAATTNHHRLYTHSKSKYEALVNIKPKFGNWYSLPA